MPNEVLKPPSPVADRAHTPFHNEGAVNKPVMLSGGKMLAIDLEKSRRFYAEFCGLETVRHKPNGLLLRDGRHRLGGPYWYIEVIQRDTIERPQHMLNHWGIDLADNAAVDRCCDLARRHAAEYGIKYVQDPHVQHGDYAFYLTDRDDNWWEFQTQREHRSVRPDQGDIIPTYRPTAFPPGEPRRLGAK